MILYVENSKDSINKLLETNKNFSRIAETKSTHKSVAFLYTNNEQLEREIKKTIPFTVASKRIVSLGINLTKEAKHLYTKNYKTLLKEIQYINKCEAIKYGLNVCSSPFVCGSPNLQCDGIWR